MRESPHLPPSQAQGLALLDRLRAGARSASEEFAEAYFDWLVARMRQAYRKAGEDVWIQAAGDALLSLILHPYSYDPARLPLDRYLEMAARGDLKNLLQAERRHRQPIRQQDGTVVARVVALSDARPETLMDPAADPALQAEQREALREARAWEAGRLPSTATATLTPAEVAVLDLMREGERRTAAYVAVLGLDHLSLAEQRRTVKRIKDKLSARIRRVGGSR